jgi:hypothetical protein
MCWVELVLVVALLTVLKVRVASAKKVDILAPLSAMEEEATIYIVASAY